MDDYKEQMERVNNYRSAESKRVEENKSLKVSIRDLRLSRENNWYSDGVFRGRISAGTSPVVVKNI